MNLAWTQAMNLFGTGGIGSALNFQIRSKSAGQAECKPVIGNGTSIKNLML